jgi:hypothetical protein
MQRVVFTERKEKEKKNTNNQEGSESENRESMKATKQGIKKARRK